MDLEDEDFDMDDIRPFPNEGDEWKTRAMEEAARPLMKLAMQILKTTEAIVETLPENEEEQMEHYRGWMMENALKLAPKISGAMATGDYILMMENAVIIKLAGRELLTITSGLKMFGYKNHDYLNALRAELEEFRKLFVKWVRTFKREEPLWPDGWALFYNEDDVTKWNSLNPDDRVREE